MQHKKPTLFSRKWRKDLNAVQIASTWPEPLYYDWATNTPVDKMDTTVPSGFMRQAVSGYIDLDKIMHPIFGDPITNYSIKAHPEVYSATNGWYEPHYSPIGGLRLTRTGSRLNINSGKKYIACNTVDNGAPFDENLKKAPVRIILQVQNKLL